MIKFLLKRPIAVIMAFLAFTIIGLITYFTIPVSLLPDIAIPEITVQISGNQTSARELENTLVRPIRNQLLQVGRLRDISSNTRDGSAIIRLKFDFGTDTDLAFIEVNEKIDASMSRLPRNVERPRVVKASATDIPVFCLNISLKSDSAFQKTNEASFLELSEFAESVIKRRIEQLPEVAMVDISGVTKQEIRIIPDERIMAMSGLNLSDIESALLNNNIEPGSMSVQDGYYVYNIKVLSLLRTKEDVEKILIRKQDRIFQLKDLAQVDMRAKDMRGISVAQGKQSVTLAIIKQSDESMTQMKEALSKVTSSFETEYPEMEFTITRNQTELLDYTISNLKQNLIIGFVFICIVAILFLGDVKSPFVIALSMIVSLIISFLFFYLCHVTLNIVSLSGLILALGMMIDSSIIVTENITQYKDQGYSLDEACDLGTSEVITPMLSSALTTIAVFIPLVFLSGIAGVIFFDQAFAVTVGLLVSYFTGILLLPVLYKLIYGKEFFKGSLLPKSFQKGIHGNYLDRAYEAGMRFTFKHKILNTVLFIIVIPLCVFFFMIIEKERMPALKQADRMAFIEWNEPIPMAENRKRIDQLFLTIHSDLEENNGYIGEQQFLLNRDRTLTSSEADIYFRVSESSKVKNIEKRIQAWLSKYYPEATVEFTPPANLFERIFETGEAELVSEMYYKNRSYIPKSEEIRKVGERIERVTKTKPSKVAFANQINITLDKEKLLLYNVDLDAVHKILRTAMKENEVTLLRSYQQFIPINLSGKNKSINEIVTETLITVQDRKTDQSYDVPLSSILKIEPSEDVKTITAGKNGEFIGFSFTDVDGNEAIISSVKSEFLADKDWDIKLSGSYFSNKQMINEMVVILFISILLMYFILAAQFESFLQPLIVLLEIPIDIAFALLLLWLCGDTLNLMSAIGIIVTCGIIINDSILKIDAINELRKNGMPMIEAIHTAGHRRLRPIVMTSLTTIFAMVPVLFTSDMGSELQKPFAIAVIGAMGMGTLVSLFMIPLAYDFIYGRKDQKKHA